MERLRRGEVERREDEGKRGREVEKRRREGLRR